MYPNSLARLARLLARNVSSVIRTTSQFLTSKAVVTSLVIVLVLPPLTLTCPAQFF
jgi:hypothetical protein